MWMLTNFVLSKLFAIFMEIKNVLNCKKSFRQYNKEEVLNVFYGLNLLGGSISHCSNK